MFIRILILIVCISSCVVSQAQMGIGTTNPYRDLEVYGSGLQRIRVHSISSLDGLSGLELVRGINNDSPVDWQIVNDAGTFKIRSGNFKLNNSQIERLRVTKDFEVGIGTAAPQSKVHILDYRDASLTDDGYLMLGQSTSMNLIFDTNEILARNNGNPGTLYIQAHGGNTYFNYNGGHVRLGNGNGRLGIGTSDPSRRTSIHGTDWHLYLNNNGNGGSDNDWYIGATGPSWAAGGDQLVFSPNASSSNAGLRLRDVTENNGIVAPVSIHGSGNQELLIDGNELDTKNGALYINYNSGYNTYINPSGGEVGVGTTTTNATLSIYSPVSVDPLSFQRAGLRWDIVPDLPDGPGPDGGLMWDLVDVNIAMIHGTNGAWLSASDARLKENIRPVNDLLTRMKDVDIYTYSFKSDPDQQRFIGVMAQEIAHLFPETVVESGPYTGVAYGQLAVAALKAIQEQQDLIDRLESQIAALESN